MRILAIADIEDTVWKFGSGKADVLISCGDVDDHLISQAADAYSCQNILAVKGNHDRPLAFPDPIIDLHLNVVDMGGLRFGGFNGCVRYKPRGAFLWDQEKATRLLDGFPRVDVFVTHSSPHGIHERQDEAHLGFKAFTTYIQRCSPRLLFHGHQHVNFCTTVGETVVQGVFGMTVVGISPRQNLGSRV